MQAPSPDSMQVDPASVYGPQAAKLNLIYAIGKLFNSDLFKLNHNSKRNSASHTMSDVDNMYTMSATSNKYTMPFINFSQSLGEGSTSSHLLQILIT